MTRISAAAPIALLLALAACGRPAPPAAPADRIYVTNENSGDLSVIDAGTLQVLQTTPLGKRPRGMALSPDGRRLYIALTGSPAAPPGVDEDKLPPRDATADGVGVFEVGQGKVIQVLRGISDPEQLTIGADGTLYAGSEEAEAVITVPTAGGAPQRVPIGVEPEGVEISPDGTVLYVTLEEKSQVAVVDLKSRRILTTLPVGERPRSVAFSPDGARAYVPGELGRTLTIIDAKAHKVLTTAPIPGAEAKPMGVVVAPDGAAVFVTTGRGKQLVKMDASTGAVLGSVEVGARPWGLAISADGKRIYTANGSSNDIAVVDAASMRVTGRVKVGERPWGVKVAPAPR